VELIMGRFKLSDPDSWDAEMRERVVGAQRWDGWMGVTVVKPVDAPDERVVLALWRERSCYESWVASADYEASVQSMARYQTAPPVTRWHQVVVSLGLPGGPAESRS
jgi:heme-degrading monooxygenase HmoA